MVYRISVAFIEMASVVLFLLAMRRSLAKGRARAAELFFAFLYGLLLEELDIYFFRTYHYGPGFFLQLGHAPVAIALLWALILCSSMAISDRLALPAPARPFLDGILALVIDIGVDAIAIRIGYWTWMIPLTEGWFGVPAGNLYSWMWVAFHYSLVTRLVRLLGKKDPGRYAYQTLAPLAAYLLLFVTIVSAGLVQGALEFDRESEKLWILYGHVGLFGAAAVAGLLWRRAGVRSEEVPGVLAGSRLAIHVYFLAAYFATGMARQIPFLGFIAFLAFGLELGLARLTRR